MSYVLVKQIFWQALKGRNLGLQAVVPFAVVLVILLAIALIYMVAVRQPSFIAEPLLVDVESDWIRSVAFEVSGTWLAVASGQEVYVLLANDLSAEPILLGDHEDPVEAVAFGPAERWLVSAGLGRSVRLWPVASDATE